MEPTILQKEDSKLRQVSREVREDEIGSAYIDEIIARMIEAMNAEDDSAAIAAPQIGENLRIFVISEKILPESHQGKDLVFINPVIVKRSKQKVVVEEGCLSVRWLYGDVERHEKVTVEALDEHGKKRVYGGSGLVSQAFQHEIDHLDGILFIDAAKNVRELPPDEQTEHEHAL